MGHEVPATPVVFGKPPTAVVGDGDEVAVTIEGIGTLRNRIG